MWSLWPRQEGEDEEEHKAGYAASIAFIAECYLEALYERVVARPTAPSTLG